MSIEGRGPPHVVVTCGDFLPSTTVRRVAHPSSRENVFGLHHFAQPACRPSYSPVTTLGGIINPCELKRTKSPERLCHPPLIGINNGETIKHLLRKISLIRHRGAFLRRHAPNDRDIFLPIACKPNADRQSQAQFVFCARRRVRKQCEYDVGAEEGLVSPTNDKCATYP